MLRKQNAEINIIEYIKSAPTPNELKVVLEKLNLSPKKILRTKDSRYKELQLDSFEGLDDELLQIISNNPRILERPIIIYKNKAVIGRPPENILKLLNK